MIYFFFSFCSSILLFVFFLIISFVITIAVRSPAVMTTSRIPAEYYTSDEFAYRNNKTRIIPRQNYSHNSGVITKKTKNGSYNIIEKDFGDHKVIYHVPIEYGDDYDISQLEDIPINEEQQQLSNTPKLVRRRIYQQYDNYDYDDEADDDGGDYEYVEEMPVVTPRRRVYVSPRRSNDTQVIKRIYERESPTQRVEYIYEDDYSDVYPDNQEEVQYIVRERVPKPTYMEEPQPVRRTLYVQDPPPLPLPSTRQPPSPPPPPHFPPPVSHSPRRTSYQSSPRSVVNQKSPLPSPTRPNRRNNISPQASARKQQTTRSPAIYEPPVKPNIPKTNEPPLRLMDVIAQNRAKRGPGIPKPKREIDEEKVYDKPTYQRNIIKNGFIVHK